MLWQGLVREASTSSSFSSLWVSHNADTLTTFHLLHLALSSSVVMNNNLPTCAQPVPNGVIVQTENTNPLAEVFVQSRSCWPAGRTARTKASTRASRTRGLELLDKSLHEPRPSRTRASTTESHAGRRHFPTKVIYYFWGKLLLLIIKEEIKGKNMFSFPSKITQTTAGMLGYVTYDLFCLYCDWYFTQKTK